MGCSTQVINQIDTLEKVESTLKGYCQNKILAARTIGSGYEQLWQEISDYLLAGGKRIRPHLVLLAYGAYGGESVDTVLPAATAWELLHACLLVHDDIIDRDTYRHGRLNISGRYEQLYAPYAQTDSGHYALSSALLAGDLLLSSAYDIVTQSSLDADKKVLVLGQLQDALFAVGGGELIDVESVLYSIEQSNPTAIATYKTATYSFQLPLMCGAMLADASQEELEMLQSIGTEVGIAFQLKDDVLGVFGSEQTTGKSNRSDIYEKKRTLLTKLALERLSEEKAARLESLYRLDEPMTDIEAEEAVALFAEAGVRQLVDQEVDERAARAVELVKRLGVPDTHKGALLDLIARLSKRVA